MAQKAHTTRGTLEGGGLWSGFGFVLRMPSWGPESPFRMRVNGRGYSEGKGPVVVLYSTCACFLPPSLPTSVVHPWLGSQRPFQSNPLLPRDWGEDQSSPTKCSGEMCSLARPTPKHTETHVLASCPWYLTEPKWTEEKWNCQKKRSLILAVPVICWKVVVTQCWI